MKAYADVTFAGGLKVTNISLIENANGGMFISMPRYKSGEVDENGNAVYKDICNPITIEFRDALYGTLADAYKESCASGQSATKEINDLRNADASLKMDAKVYPIRKENAKSLAYAKIYLDKAFVINNVSIMEGKNGAFVAMHSYKTKKFDENGNPEYRDICYPVTKEAREKLRDVIFEEYNKVKDEARDTKVYNKSSNEYVPEWVKAAEEELPFPSKPDVMEERNMGYIPVEQSGRKEERQDKPIEVRGEKVRK